MSEVTLAVGDGVCRMTYAELAEARSISITAARRLTLRHRWAKQTGNDGLVRVSVPLSALAKSRKIAGAGKGATDTGQDPALDALSDSTRALRALERAVDTLR